jgi:glycerol-3-phosphate O-acyltransferase
MLNKKIDRVIEIALEYYNQSRLSETSKSLSESERKIIKQEIKEIADRRNNALIDLTKFLKPLILPTARRIVLESHLDFSTVNNPKNIVVYMPNHKSHLDEFVIGYTLLANNLPVPITAAGENLFRSKVSNYMLRSYGAFKLRRDKYSDDVHYVRLLSSYLAASIMTGKHIMTFQEGTRPRDGKIALFRKGMIATIEKLFRQMKGNPDIDIEDITFIPIAVNWSENPDEKKMTADMNTKAEETDLFKRFLNLKKTHSSKDIRGVYLGFGEPLSYNQFAAAHAPDNDDSYAIGICNEVRSRVVNMMPVFKEHLLYSSIQYLCKYKHKVDVEEAKNLMEVTQKNISDGDVKINVIETDNYSVESQLELMEKRDIIEFNEDRTVFNVRKHNVVDYYANHVAPLIEERRK